jgi:FeS assembly SUF system protein
MDKKKAEREIIEKLKEVYDPEIPVNVYEIGLIYEVKVNDHGKADILMTLTSPNCPVAESLPLEVKQKAEEVEEIVEASVELTFDPPWNMDMLSDEAKLELGMF